MKKARNELIVHGFGKSQSDLVAAGDAPVEPSSPLARSSQVQVIPATGMLGVSELVVDHILLEIVVLCGLKLGLAAFQLTPAKPNPREPVVSVTVIVCFHSCGDT